MVGCFRGASLPMHRTIGHERPSVEGCYKEKHFMFPTKRKRFCLIKALNAKRGKPAHAESLFLDKLLAVGLGIFDLIQASFRIYLHDDIFASPLLEAKVVEIDEGANREGHSSINVPNDFFMGRYTPWSRR